MASSEKEEKYFKELDTVVKAMAAEKNSTTDEFFVSFIRVFPSDLVKVLY